MQVVEIIVIVVVEVVVEVEGAAAEVTTNLAVLATTLTTIITGIIEVGITLIVRSFMATALIVESLATELKTVPEQMVVQRNHCM